MHKPTLLHHKEFLLMGYKLLYDLLFLNIFSFFLMLILEGILPLFVSGRISFTLILITLALNVMALAHLGKKLGLSYKRPNPTKNILLPILVVYAFILIGNALLKFALWENLIITVGTLIVFFLLYLIITSPNKKTADAVVSKKKL